MSEDDRSLKPASRLVKAGRGHDVGDSLNVPLVPASNFVLGGARGYARNDGTPGWEALEEIVGELEGGQAVVFSSGMAAIAAIFDQLPVGSRIALPADCYQGVAGYVAAGEEKGRWKTTRLDLHDTQAWLSACQTHDMVWLESPSNPLLVVADVVQICGAPRKAGCILAVDNTFATPLNQQPLALGADVSVQSATKYIGGHSDLLAGVASANKPALVQALRRTRALSGAVPGALEVYLAVRGVRTLALRLERAEQNAMQIATRLEAHPGVSLVRYPGLPSHPTHQAAVDQLAGFGTVISFDVSGVAETADAVCSHVRLIRHATSLGGVESTIERRGANAGQEHLPPTLLRMSVGIEDVDDIWADLDQALLAASV